MKVFRIIFLIASMALLFASLVGAQAAPGLVAYQGRLTSSSGNPVPDGVYSVQFSLYSDPVAVGPIYWQEVHSITTTDGLFSVTLGTIDALDRFVLLGLPSVSLAYLGIKVGSDPEMTPRVRLTSVLYAQEATHVLIVSTVNQATGGTITSNLRLNDSLEVGGNVKVSGKIDILTDAGPTVKPQFGERWRDNNIVAWGRVTADGRIRSSYGVDSVQHISTGHYYVYLGNSFGVSTNNMVPLAQAICAIENPYVTSVLPLTGSMIEVGLKFLPTNTIEDCEFVFMVTGR